MGIFEMGYIKNAALRKVVAMPTQHGFFAKRTCWDLARRRARNYKKCTSAAIRLATPANTVAHTTNSSSRTFAMVALDFTQFASTGVTAIQATASAASVSCVSSAGKVETMARL